jgi:putative tricarboxylic transport membrane protein
LTSFRRDLICSLILLVVAVCYYVAAIRIGQTALSDAVGPAGLPRIYGIALAVVGIAIGVTAWLRHRLETAADPGSASPRAQRQLVRGAGALAIGIGYLIIVSAIGYPFAMALLIAAMAAYQGERFSLRLLLVAAAGAAALYLLFDIVLGVRLPAPWNG